MCDNNLTKLPRPELYGHMHSKDSSWQALKAHQLEYILETANKAFRLAVLSLSVCPSQELRQATYAAVLQGWCTHNWQILFAGRVKATIDPGNVFVACSGQLLAGSKRPVMTKHA